MKYLLILGFFCCFTSLKSQEIDRVKLKITYSLNFVMDTTNPQKISHDVMVLKIGKTVVNFYSYKQFVSDSTIKADKEKGVTDADIMANLRKYRGTRNKYVLFKNYPAHVITTYDRLLTDHFTYTEPLKNPTWNISHETQKILGYDCTKATTHFLGRTYEAWFTAQIAVAEGWKLAGLPGLILKAKDTRDQYVFECIGIENVNNTLPIVLPQENYVAVSKAEFKKMFKRYSVDPIGYIAQSNGASTYREGNKPVEEKPENTIELNEIKP